MAIIEVNIKDVQNRDIKTKFDDTAPDECPVCHSKVSPKLLTRVVARLNTPEHHLQAAYQCTADDCNSIFVAVYKGRVPLTNSTPYFKITEVRPLMPQTHSFHETITELSPTFVTIYNQSIAAESSGLDQLTGIGLRKALEFLLKDFAISNHPDDEEEIRKVMLAKCIDKYVDDVRIKECAKRAVWLGNDETHYTRKWEGKDINDLKILIRLTTNWVENVLLTERYMEDMVH